MIYITGDTHGAFDRIQEFCNQWNTTKDDIMIILGDAGINYYLNKRDENPKCKLDEIPITLFCIHGNHEQRPKMIASYEEIEWCGGIVYLEKDHPDILFAKDGEVYNFNGNQVLVLGGAYSVDKFYRLEKGLRWFDSEQPTEETKQRVAKKLEKMNWKVDYVLSHTSPLKYEPVESFLPMIDQSTVDKTTEQWLDSIEDKLDYKRWYCGHYHIEKRIDKVCFLFESVEEFA